MKYIVLLIHPNGSAVPLLADDDYTMRAFDTHSDALDHARRTTFGHSFGFTVLRWDQGVEEVL